MNVDVNVDVDVKRIPPKINNAVDRAQMILINQAHADMNQFVPFKYGPLRNTSYITLDNKSIIYTVPYARIQFYTQFSNYTTPGTGPRWDLKAKAIHGASWARVAGRAMNLK